MRDNELCMWRGTDSQADERRAEQERAKQAEEAEKAKKLVLSAAPFQCAAMSLIVAWPSPHAGGGD